MRKSTSTLTPAQVCRYAVQTFQPHLKLSNAKGVVAETILTVLFAAGEKGDILRRPERTSLINGRGILG